MPYLDDLARIHDAGFGHFARAAAGWLAAELARSGFDDGLVVEAGCGSGISAQVLADAGYTVEGFDLSPAMIELARGRAPGASLRVESLATASIPPCIAVTAIGEILNYRFDPQSLGAARERLFERVFGGLAPGGVFVFDCAGPARLPDGGGSRNFFEDEGWALLVEVAGGDAPGTLRRRITSFSREGGLWRRSDELHELELLEPAALVESLARIGFSVATMDRYGEQPLPRGLTAFVARKPA